MTRKERIRSAYKLTGGHANFYDGMMTYSTIPGKAICRLVWNMDGEKNLSYLETALAGVPEAERENLSKVLADLDYNVLKVELKRGKDGEDSSLGLKIEGSATRGNTTVPVNLDVTFHGDLDQLINTGMKLRRKTR